MRVKATIQVNGRPLRRAYVEHLVFGVGTEMYMTDLEGRIRDTHFDQGIDSLTNNADIRVICQNPIVRVLDGNRANIGVYQDKSIVDGATVNLDKNAEQDDYYAILNRAHIAYEVVFRPLSFFRNLPDPDFPLGRKPSLRSTRDQARRIDLSFPDQFPSPLAFVEPKQLVDNFPLMHIKARTSDGRLFGENGSAPTLIPGELAHALHFSFLNEAKRGRAQDKYIEFITGNVLAGGPGTHDFTVRTTPEVAYIETADWFSQTFMEFMRARQEGDSTLVRPETITRAIQAEFVASEWARLTESRVPVIRPDIQPRIGPGNLTGGAPVNTTTLRQSRLLLRPTVTGGDVEGAVYGAIFADFAGSVGLDFAASSYFEANALTFGEYREFINSKHPEHSATLEEVRRFWGL
jgi:hypothetical protein